MRTGWTVDSLGELDNSSELLCPGAFGVADLINGRFEHTNASMKMDMSKF